MYDYSMYYNLTFKNFLFNFNVGCICDLRGRRIKYDLYLFLEDNGYSWMALRLHLMGKINW